MGKSLNYFKNYEIQFDDSIHAHRIVCLDGDSFDLSYKSIAVLTDMLEYFHVRIPTYDFDFLLNSQRFSLLDPKLVSAGCVLAIGLLQREENPVITIFEEEKEALWGGEPDVSEKNRSLQRLLHRLLNLSEEGYYFTFDNE